MAKLQRTDDAHSEAFESPLTLGELYAHVAGTFDDDEADFVLERLLADAEATRLAATMTRFFDARDRLEIDASEPIEAELDASELEDDWRRLRQRVGLDSGDPPLPHPAESVPKATASPMPWHLWLSPALAGAAGIVLAMTVGSADRARLEHQLREPRVNVESRTIWEDSTRSSSAQPTVLSGTGAFQSLVLTLSSENIAPRGQFQGQPLGDYALEIWPRAEPNRSSPSWRAENVRIETGNIVTLELVRGYLAPGVYDVRLLAIADRDQVVASFAIEVP